MKIAQVNVYFYPLMLGGAEWYVYNISRNLVKRGHEVHVFTASKYLGKDIGPAEDEVEGIVVHRVPLRFDLTYRAKIWKDLKKLLLENNFDVIHTYDYAQPHSNTAANVGKELKKPVFLTVFDVHSLIPRVFYKNFFMKIFDRYFARYVFEKCTKILVRAPNLVDALVKFGAEREKIIVTPSGILDEALKPAEGKVFLEKFHVSGFPVIMYLGRLNPLKGPQHIIMASPKILREFPDAAFVFIGPDQGGYGKSLFKLAEELGVKERLVFTGPIYDFDLKMQAYAASNVFVLPSGYEGTSQAVFEAMAQAKPIVATNRGGIPFQVRHEEEALLVDYGDVEALASSILRLLRDDELASRVGRNAKRRVANFTYSALVSQMEEIYGQSVCHLL